MKIELPSGNAMGANYGGIVVKSPTEFTWEEGRVYLEDYLDDEIYRYNLVVQSKAKKLGKTLNPFYQFIRDGPIVKCLYGPAKEPIYFESKYEKSGWFCKYRYKARVGTTEDYLGSMWWNKAREAGSKKGMDNFMKEREVEEKDEALY